MSPTIAPKSGTSSISARRADPEYLLDAFFNPGSIALIGASSKEKSVGYGIFRNLLYGNFHGVVYPVNPKARSILGVKTYASLAEVPDEIDLAVIIVPRDHVAGIIEECGMAGVKAAVVITAGFKEIGGEGVKYEQEIIKAARKHNLPLLGPNCLGVINTSHEIRLNATFAKRLPKPGNVSFISQSGAIGVHALEYAASNDIGFAKFVSIGNKAILNENDLLGVIAADPDTKVILTYTENFEDPHQFFKQAAAITRGKDPKPIIAIKTGTSESGKRAAASHTGALAERDDVLDDLFAQCGVIRALTMEQLFDFALCFANQPVPKGNRLAIITNAGGPGIIATDEAERNGLHVVELSDKLQEKIKRYLPPTVSAKNPIDLVGDADETRYELALKAIIDSDEVDSILVLSTPQVMTEMTEVARIVAEHAQSARKAGKTLVTSFAGFGDISIIMQVLDLQNVPNYRFGESAVQAIAAAMRFGKWTQRSADMPSLPEPDRDQVATVIKEARDVGRTFISESESYKVFQAYGFDIAPYQLVRSAEAAKAAGGKLGYPLVAKIVSPNVIHKFDVGGVQVNIKNEQELIAAFHQLRSEVRKHNPDSDIHGILLQRMVQDGVEVIMGANYNPHYGHLLMFGLGGILVEVLKDVTFRLAPITQADADEMINGIRTAKMLDGYRGMPARDKATLSRYLIQLSQLLMDFPEIAEIDLNPVFALEQGACVADARIILKQAVEGLN